MYIPNAFCEYYKDFLSNTYDCVDRIVLNAYFPLIQSGGGFRFWWRKIFGNDENLDNTHLMRFAGRFSRRIRAFTKNHDIPLIYCKSDERKYDISKEYIPSSPDLKGVFCILVNRAPAPVMDIKHFGNGGIDIRKKSPYPYVNHYSFHIMDSEWGHLVIRFCPHPPFPAQIILNGHEYVAIQARKAGIAFEKEDNCFTSVAKEADLAMIADTMKASGFEGRLRQVCDTWIYSSCLVFALDMDDQKRSGFHYSYSIFQCEYSRNLLFTRGRVMDELFQSIIDRTRTLLNIKILKTIFGYKYRPYKKNKSNKKPPFEVKIENPVYDMTIFKIIFGLITVKMYSKGEHVLRTEVVVHNTKWLKCGKIIHRFPDIVNSLSTILENFQHNLCGINASFIGPDKLSEWPLPTTVGSTRVGGIDINKSRTIAVMKAIIALCVQPNGFTSSDVAKQVMNIVKQPDFIYTVRQASYDLKKFRSKNIVQRIDRSRRYKPTDEGLRSITAFIILRNKVIYPLLTSMVSQPCHASFQENSLDSHYIKMRTDMTEIFNTLGIAA